MTSIHDLFDENLEEIFSKLPLHDRLICKEVCRRWYTLLMESAYFKEDRHIYLRSNLIKTGQAPINFLLNAQKPYPIYTILDNCKKTNNALIQFLKSAKGSIEELIYIGYKNYEKIISPLESLKSLIMKDASLKYVDSELAKIKEQNPNSLQNLEKIQIGCTTQVNWNEMINKVHNIKKLLPKNCLIIVSDATVREKRDIEGLCRVMELTTFKKLSIYLKEESDTEKLLGVKDMKCDEFILNCPSHLRPFHLSETLQNKHENLKKIKIITDNLPTVAFDLSKLTELVLKLTSPFVSLKKLEQFGNLKELQLEIEVNDCGFSHDPLIMPKLKRFQITVKKFCDECVNGLADSFENLEEFTYRSETAALTWKQFSKISKKWSANLRVLNIGEIPNIPLKDIKKLPKLYPHLQNLELRTKNDPAVTPISKVIPVIMPALTKLSTFAYGFKKDTMNSTDREFKLFCNYMKSIGLPILSRDGSQETAHQDFFNDTLEFKNVNYVRCYFNWKFKHRPMSSQFYVLGEYRERMHTDYCGCDSADDYY